MKLIIVSGATATGKTNLAIEICQKHPDFEILNFDSLLFYKELNVGTAKPTQEELKLINHHLVDISSIKNEINCSQFVEMAKNIISTNKKNLVLVGGSAFYLRALFTEMYQGTSTKQNTNEFKDFIKTKYDSEGIQYFLEYLKQHDPESLNNLHINDHYRLMRAVEFHLETGSKISDEKLKARNEDPYHLKSINGLPFIHINLQIPKEYHWEIIQKRTLGMIQNGLIDEVQNLLNSGFTLNDKPLQSIGYKETIEYLLQTEKVPSLKIDTIEKLRDRISISTRQLSKSQKTFFKKMTPMTIIDPTGPNKWEHLIDEFIAN